MSSTSAKAAGERRQRDRAGSGATAASCRTGLRYASWWRRRRWSRWSSPIHYAADRRGSIYAFTDHKGAGNSTSSVCDNFVKISSGARSMKALINTLIIAFVFLIATNGIGLAFALAEPHAASGISCGSSSRPGGAEPLAVSSSGSSSTSKRAAEQFLASIGWSPGSRPGWESSRGAVHDSGRHGLAERRSDHGRSSWRGWPTCRGPGRGRGAGRGGVWKRFTSVTLPMLPPTIVVASTLILIQGLRSSTRCRH